MGVGFVGAVIDGYVRDVDEIRDKLGKEFNVFARGASPVAASQTVAGEVGAPVTINGVTIRTGDLIVGDSDGVICVPKDQVEQAAEKCRMGIVDDVNLLQLVREGHGAVDDQVAARGRPGHDLGIADVAHDMLDAVAAIGVGEVFQVSDLGVEFHHGQRSTVARKLQFGLFNVI